MADKHDVWQRAVAKGEACRMSTILDFYADESDFEEALEEAEEAAVTEREQDFVASLQERLEEWGRKMHLSEAQHAWLERIIAGE